MQPAPEFIFERHTGFVSIYKNGTFDNGRYLRFTKLHRTLQSMESLCRIANIRKVLGQQSRRFRRIRRVSRASRTPRLVGLKSDLEPIKRKSVGEISEDQPDQQPCSAQNWFAVRRR